MGRSRFVGVFLAQINIYEYVAAISGQKCILDASICFVGKIYLEIFVGDDIVTEKSLVDTIIQTMPLVVSVFGNYPTVGR